MKFGIYAPIPMTTVGSPEVAQAAQQARAPLPQQAQDGQYSHALELLLAADAVGFDLTLYAERHLGSDLAAWVLASAVAPRCRNMRALVAVHPGLWDPVLVAKLAVSLDRIVGPRMAINVVNGWFDEEFRMFGGTVLAGEERYRRTIEFIEILRGLWQNETFSYAGQHYNLDKGQLLLKPATATPPEIFSVSTSDRGRDFVAETCDWWFVEFPKQAATTDELLRSLEASIADMTGRTKATGRKLRYAINPFVALGVDEERAVKETVDRIQDFDPDPDTRKIERRILPATKAGFMGRPEAVRRQVQRFADMGFELLLLKMIATTDNVKEIGAEVIGPCRAGVAA